MGSLRCDRLWSRLCSSYAGQGFNCLRRTPRARQCLCRFGGSGRNASTIFHPAGMTKLQPRRFPGLAAVRLSIKFSNSGAPIHWPLAVDQQLVRDG